MRLRWQALALAADPRDASRDATRRRGRGREGRRRFSGSFLPDGVTSLDTDAGGVDVHVQPPGAAPYPLLRRRALVIEVAGTTVAVAGLDDLIAMKRASGQPIDRGDVVALTAPERE